MELYRGEGEIPSPIPISSKYGGEHGHEPPSLHHTSNGPAHPPATDGNQYTCNNGGKREGLVIRYRECKKNHAASIGGNATDGCGEFMPGGGEGTTEALRCSACGCHRNFHRKDVEGESLLRHRRHHHHPKPVVGHTGVLLSGSDAFGCYAPSHNSLIPLPSPHRMIMPVGAMQTSESEEMEGGVGGGGLSRHHHHPLVMRKRARTKFTQEQKEKMLSFAERVGWRLQKQEETLVHQFCREIGVKRRVLKVWMHNNKHSFAGKKNSNQLSNSSPTTPCHC